MSEFTPDPRSCFVALLDGVEYEMFGALPDHPAQRQTTLHAANLLASGVLFPTLDVHREVAALLIGNPDNGVTIEMMMVAFKENVREALTRYGVKLNGHTRHFLWEYPGGPPRPANVRLSVYAAADRDSAVQQYNAVDSLQAVKGRKHTMQSTLNVAGIEPRSAYLKAASNLAGALDAAVWILHGGAPEYRGLKLLPPPGSVADPLRPELHVLLPHLRAVEVFKPALVGLDADQPVGRSGTFVTARLCRRLPVDPVPGSGAWPRIHHPAARGRFGRIQRRTDGCVLCSQKGR